ncbi:MAG: raffinose synthase [Clostridia bacterium]|nr:raffinose synthase [Clostridia bacterium]
MISVVDKTGFQILENNNCLLRGSLPKIVLDNREAVTWDTVECNKANIVCSTESGITCTLSIVTEGNRFAIGMTYQSTSLMVGGKSHCIDSLEGIQIHFAVDKLDRALANYLSEDWWTKPFHTSNLADVPARTQSLLCKNKSNTYLYMLPVCSENTKSSFEGGQGLTLRSTPGTGGFANFSSLLLCGCIGEEPYELSTHAADYAMELLGKPKVNVQSKLYPEMLEYLGWCSWDAFYYEISEENMLLKMKEMREKKVPIRWTIIDCGWSDAEDYALSSFDADKVRFPNGLKGCVEKIKKDYKIDWVGAWHTIIGYWNGISHNSKLAYEQRENLYTTHCNKLMPYPDKKKVFDFFNTWHTLLKSDGIDFVKVDYQSVLINMLRNNFSIGQAAKEIHTGLEASVAINFNGNMINCMGMANENLFNRPVSLISRNSDDFFPLKEHWFKEHATQNAYNCYYHRAFVHTDWDMWWSNHPNSTQNALLRAISGGPIYTSDKLGETIVDEYMPLIFKDGRILRCDGQGLPTEDCLLQNCLESQLALKIHNYEKDTHYIAAFNINGENEPVKYEVKLSDCIGLDTSSREYVSFEHFGGQLDYVSKDSKYVGEIASEELKLYSFTPIVNGIALIGDEQKYIKSKVIKNTIWLGSNRVIAELYQGCSFIFTTRRSVVRTMLNDREVTFIKDRDKYTVDTAFFEGNCVLEIEVGN